MKKLQLKVLIVLMFFINISCGGGGDDSPPPPPPVDPPTAASLLTPANNEVCLTGTSISNTQAQVSFTWNASPNTDSYSVVVKNLITDVISTYNANTNQTTITLNKAEPYSWHIVSKSNATTQTAQSPTWKFYLAGDAEINYAPFPATINFPTPGSTITGTSTKLEWTGSDVDNDIVSYQVYLDITAASTLLSTTTNSTIENVAIQNGNTYYWKVITTDSQGNTSSSGVFTFKVN